MPRLTATYKQSLTTVAHTPSMSINTFVVVLLQTILDTADKLMHDVNARLNHTTAL